MPLADLTAIANLALDHLGEPYLADFSTDTTVAALAARLHMPQCIETVLEGHVWSFATRCSQLNLAPVNTTTATLAIGTGADNNAILLTAVAPGPAGDDITLEILETGEVVGKDMVVTGTLSPDGTGTLKPAGFVAGFPVWTSTGLPMNVNTTGLTYNGERWNLSKIGATIVDIKIWRAAVGTEASPDLATGWAAVSPATGTPVVVASPFYSYWTGAEAVANAITINPLKARMIISGTNTPDFNGTLVYAGEANGKPFYSSTGEPYNTDGSDVGTIEDGVYLYECRQLVLKEAGQVTGLWLASVVGRTPDLSGTWLPDVTEGGSLVVTAGSATAAMVIDALNDTASTAALVTAASNYGSDGTGVVGYLAETHLSGGSSTSSVFAPAYGSAFNLPADCLRVIKLDGPDIDIPRNRWEIQGRYLLLEEELAEAPVIHYISKDPPVDEWPTTFTDAVAFLLASRLAPKLSQDQGLANDFLQKHEMALGKARSKDARETRSNENFGPRQLAARSGLVRARYGNSHPPY